MIMVRVPVRIEFAGGSTDIDYFYTRHTGYVLNATINKYIYVCVNSRQDSDSKIVHDAIEYITDHVKIKHSRIQAILRREKITEPVEIVSMSDITSKGSGLGASSAFTVGLIQAIKEYKKEKITPRELAEEACRIEINILKEPIGKQDQYAAAFGGINLLTFNKDGYVGVEKVNVSPVNLRKLQSHLLVISTGYGHSAADILKRQKANIADKMPYMIQMAALVPKIKKALQAGDMKEFGLLVEKEWNIKKNLSSDITNSRIERMYKIAKEHGAYGGRVSGAGGGGFMILIAAPNKQKGIKNALSNATVLECAITNEKSQIFYKNKRHG